MWVSDKHDKLKERIEKERKHKIDYTVFPSERLEFHRMHKRKIEKEKKKTLMDDLNFLKKLLKMIEQGATGFELAYEVEKNQFIKKLIVEGVLFYNTFIQVGEEIFISIPDKKKVDYQSFRTVEDTEKHLFMIWIRDTIAKLEKRIYLKDNHTRYREAKDRYSKFESVKTCNYCGTKIKDKNQKYCETCGSEL